MKQKRKLSAWGLWTLGLLAAGLVVYFFSAACRFAAVGFWGLGGVVGIYGLLSRLALTQPKAAAVLRWIFTGGLCLLLAGMALTLSLILNAARGDPDRDCDYVLVLGAGVDGTVPSRSLRERLEATAAYLAVHPEVNCVVSGGRGAGELTTEAECMYDWLVSHGVDPRRILMEKRASTTAENIRFTLELLEKQGVVPQRLAVVSSEYHLFRAKMVARRLGVEAQGIPAKTGLFPLKLTYYFREIFGVWYYWVFH